MTLIEFTKAINAVMLSIRGLSHDSTNSQQRYDYFSADFILETIGKEMAKNGIAILPAVVDSTTHYVNEEGKKPFFHVTANLTMTVIANDHSVSMPFFGAGIDYTAPDKAFYKAVTSSHKYFLMKLFCVGVGNEDGEHEAHSERKQKSGNKKDYAPAQNNHQPQQTDKATSGQIKRMWAIAYSKFDGDSDKKQKASDLVRTELAKYKVESTSDLTKNQISELTDTIEGKKVLGNGESPF